MMMMTVVKKRKQLNMGQALLIVVDLCQANYQTSLIIYKEFTIKNVKMHGKKKNKVGM